MQANYVQRLRMTFSKSGPTRFISHLDLARTLERALNRARIPIAYTQGFNRRPRMQMATALPLGFTSECELADILLAEKMVPEQVRQQLMAKMAPGIVIHEVKEVPLSAPSLQSCTAESTYTVILLDPVDTIRLQQRIDELLAADSWMQERVRGRRRKVYDLRPLIIDLALAEPTDNGVQIQMRLYLQPSKTGRPDEVLRALELDPLAARAHRTSIVLQDET